MICNCPVPVIWKDDKCICGGLYTAPNNEKRKRNRRPNKNVEEPQ